MCRCSNRVRVAALVRISASFTAVFAATRAHGLIRKYGLMCCRQCSRSNAMDIGFASLRCQYYPFYRLIPRTCNILSFISTCPHCTLHMYCKNLSPRNRGLLLNEQ
ncbi:hypothetical protein GUJ93_ZPchr0013g37113 [Zizania palustris]|uniref:Uncharacterized protein n=1 Tax=Zizania palustris TaxID=103762 RepID=A0A8J6C380_ZIZPA|nr:hypothetical protein GUJ93_ZPchr0013g37113 [Zizania palustris]